MVLSWVVLIYFVFIDLGMTQQKITLGSSFFKEHKIGDTAPYFGRVHVEGDDFFH